MSPCLKAVSYTHLVLGLEGADPELLVLGQLVKDVRGRGDGVGAEEQGQAGPGGCGDEPPRRGRVAGDVHVLPRLEGCRLDLVGGLEQLGGLPEVEPRLEGPQVGLHDQGLSRVLLGLSLIHI